MVTGCCSPSPPLGIRRLRSTSMEIRTPRSVGPFTRRVDGHVVDPVSPVGHAVAIVINDPTSDADVLGYLVSAHQTAAYTADQFTLPADPTLPVSTAGPLAAVYTSNSVAVPFTASDDGGSGVAAVELWVRYRANEARPWGSWAKALTATASPFTYTFGAGDGNYEFYTIAVDVANNREAAPTGADAVTRRDAADDPPDFSFGGSAVKYSSTGPITFSGGGIAVDDRSVVSVEWRLYGVKSNGHRTKLFEFKPALADDGAFDSRIESYELSDGPRSGIFVSYDVEVRAAAATQSTTRTTRIPVFTCIGDICSEAPVP